MSLESWKAEFYPTEAGECSEADALDHSIRKWAGLSKENLAKHGVALDLGTVFEVGPHNKDKRFQVAGHTCALCAHYAKNMKNQCKQCPIFLANGFECDGDRGPSVAPIYTDFVDTDDPRPMQDALAAAKEWTRREAK